MFDFLKKIFGNKSECTDCENLSADEPTFPIVEATEVSKVVETQPEVIEQPSLKMNMPTASNPTVDTPEVVETTEQSVESPSIEATDVETPTIAEVSTDTTDDTTTV